MSCFYRGGCATPKKGREAGSLVAAWLRGAWRERPPPPALEPAEVEAVLAILNRSGCAGLGWWAIRDSGLRDTPAGRALQDAFRLQVLGAARRDEAVADIFRRLAAAGIDALLGKGWAAAPAYAHRALRPYGDFDLYAEPGDAARALDALEGCGHPIDLHRGLAELADRGWGDVRARALWREAAGTRVRVFGAEDHLRLLALHMLRHGAWRPLWMCDLGAALESLPETFDWDYALRGRRAWTAGVRTAVALALELLGADAARVPEALAAPAPRWVVRSVLHQWGTPIVPHGVRRPFRAAVRRPLDIPRQLGLRWPNPVEATFDLGLGFGRFPVRLPVQVADCVARGLRFARRLARREG